MQIELNSRLWRVENRKKEANIRRKKVAWANEGTESGNVRAKGTEEGATLSLLLPIPRPHPPWVESM